MSEETRRPSEAKQGGCSASPRRWETVEGANEYIRQLEADYSKLADENRALRTPNPSPGRYADLVDAVRAYLIDTVPMCDEGGCPRLATTEMSERALCDDHMPALGSTQDAWEMDHADLWRMVEEGRNPTPWLRKGPEDRPSSPPRCTVCGASRIVGDNGRVGVCSLVLGGDGKGGCPDSLRDVSRRRRS